jgi:methyltransferase, fkbM family
MDAENEIVLDIKKFYMRLQDEESQDIFLNMLNYYLSGNLKHIYNRKRSYENSDARDSETSLYHFIYNYNNISSEEKETIIVYGVSDFNEGAAQYLQSIDINIKYFCDYSEEKQKRLCCGLEVLSPKTVVNKFKNSTILFIGEYNKVDAFMYLCIKNGIQQSQFKLIHKIDPPYFNLKFFQPCENEIFVDGGSYIGNTVLDFIKWCGGKYSKIYAIEPDLHNYEKLKKSLSDNNVKNATTIPKGLWSRSAKLNFEQNGDMTSCFIDRGTQAVPVDTLNNIVGNDPVTFIKMDIEGMELEALKGANNVIRKSKPRLAICIYHKPEDILEIPLYLAKLVPEYKYYLRQHTPFNLETVLYATL